MKREEKQDLIEKGLKARDRARKQNEQAKNNWDTVSCRLPKGTKQRIVDNGYTVNGLINKLVLEFLDNKEK